MHCLNWFMCLFSLVSDNLYYFFRCIIISPSSLFRDLESMISFMHSVISSGNVLCKLSNLIWLCTRWELSTLKIISYSYEGLIDHTFSIFYIPSSSWISCNSLSSVKSPSSSLFVDISFSCFGSAISSHFPSVTLVSLLDSSSSMSTITCSFPFPSTLGVLHASGVPIKNYFTLFIFFSISLEEEPALGALTIMEIPIEPNFPRKPLKKISYSWSQFSKLLECM